MFSRICNLIPNSPYMHSFPYIQQRSLSNCFIGQEQKITIKIPEHLKEKISNLHTKKDHLPIPDTTLILAQNSEILLRPLSGWPLIAHSIENMIRSHYNYFPITVTSNEKISELAFSMGSIVLQYHSDLALNDRVTIAKDFVNAFNLQDKLIGASINFPCPHHPFLSSESIDKTILCWALDGMHKRDIARSVTGYYIENQEWVVPHNIKELFTNGLESFTFNQFILQTNRNASHLNFYAHQKEAFTVTDEASFRIAEQILNPS